MFRRALPLLFLLGLGSAAHAGPTLALVPVDPANLVAGRTVDLDLVAFNRANSSASFPLPADASLSVVLDDGHQRWTLSLSPVDTAAGSPELQPGAFVARRYQLRLPTAASGRLVLEAHGPGDVAVSAVLDALPSAAVSSPPTSATASTEKSHHHPALTPAVDVLDRAFLDRFAAHEPIYIIYGPDAPAAKFQFSFKYRLASLTAGGADSLPTTLQFGYTQRSLWDIDASSSPFYDTSYMPEVFLEKLAPLPDAGSGWFTRLALQSGFRHESNGRDGDVSRSLNVVYLRAAFSLGDPSSWHLVVVPEIYTYVGGLSDNPTLDDYRGHGQLRLALTHATGPSLTASLQAGDDFRHGSVQLDLNIPIRLEIFDVGTYFLTQYFHGYGESLLSYDRRSETIRFGLSFVR